MRNNMQKLINDYRVSIDLISKQLMEKISREDFELETLLSEKFTILQTVISLAKKSDIDTTGLIDYLEGLYRHDQYIMKIITEHHIKTADAISNLTKISNYTHY
jgi:hypothetical protein